MNVFIFFQNAILALSPLAFAEHGIVTVSAVPSLVEPEVH